MAEKDILIRYRVDDSELIKAEAIMGRTAATTEKVQAEGEQLGQVLKKAGKESSTAFAQADKSTKTFGNNVATSKKSVLDLRGAVQNFGNTLGVSFDTSKIEAFSSGVKTIAPAVNGGTKAFQLLRIAVLAVPIFLLIAGIAALVAWFKRTDEGATTLDGIFRAFSATITVITKYLIDFGKALYSAVTNPKQALIDLGELIKNQLINRLTSVITLAQGVKKAFSGDFKGAMKDAADAAGQLVLGVNNITDKLAGVAKEIADTAKEAYDLAFAWDELADRERALSIATAEAEKAISRLLIQAKNRTKSEEERLGYLEQAAKIERANFAEQLSVAKQRLSLIQRENEISKRNGQLSDDQLDAEAEALIKVINLEKQSLDLQERIANRRDAIIEELIQNRVKKIQEAATLEENIEKDRYARSEINETQFRDRVIAIQGKSLENQKALLREYGKDTIEIEKALSDARIQARENELNDQLQLINLQRKAEEMEANKYYLLGLINKEKVEEKKTDATERSLLAQIEMLKKFNIDATELEAQYYEFKASQAEKAQEKFREETEERKKIAEEEAEHRREMVQQSADSALEGAQKVIDIFATAAAFRNKLDDNRISKLEANKAKEIEIAGDNKVKQAEIEEKYDAKVREIRRRQAERDKKIALFSAIVGTAQAVVQALGSGKYPINLLFAALTAAAGAVQISTITSQQVPAYNKGVRFVPGKGNKDTVNAMLTPGERVLTKSTNKKYTPILDAIHDNRIDPELLNGIATGRLASGGRAATNKEAELLEIQIGEKIKEGVKEALEQLPLNMFSFDERGFTRSIEKKRSKITFENKRYSSNV